MKTEIKLESKLSQFANELHELNKEEMKIILGGAYSGTSSGGGGGGGRSVSTRGNSYSSPTSNFGNTANDYSWDNINWDEVNNDGLADAAAIFVAGGVAFGYVAGAVTSIIDQANGY